MSKEHPNVELLRRFNNWRRGGNGAMPAPAEVGVAIDWAIGVCGDGGRLEMFERLCRELYEAERAKNQKDWCAVIRALENVGADETAKGTAT